MDGLLLVTTLLLGLLPPALLVWWVVHRVRQDLRESRRLFVCTHCGHSGRARTKTQGSLAIELVLWLFMILPGLVYSIWRLTTRKKSVCEACGRDAMIPADTPRGREMLGTGVNGVAGVMPAAEVGR